MSRKRGLGAGRRRAAGSRGKRSPGLRRAATCLRPFIAGVADDRAALEVAWTATVGSRLARRASLRGIEEGRLIIEVASLEWQRGIREMAGRIIEGLRAKLGRKAPRRLEVRLVPGAAVEESRAEAGEGDAASSLKPEDERECERMAEKIGDGDLREAFRRAYRAHARRYGSPDD